MRQCHVKGDPARTRRKKQKIRLLVNKSVVYPMLHHNTTLNTAATHPHASHVALASESDSCSPTMLIAVAK